MQTLSGETFCRVRSKAIALEWPTTFNKIEISNPQRVSNATKLLRTRGARLPIQASLHAPLEQTWPNSKQRQTRN